MSGMTETLFARADAAIAEALAHKVDREAIRQDMLASLERLRLSVAERVVARGLHCSSAFELEDRQRRATLP